MGRDSESHNIWDGRLGRRQLVKNLVFQDKSECTQGGMRIGKTPKKLDSICCPQHRETKADNLNQLRPIGEGDQELEKRLVQEELT
jgi:hypothetical protein